MRTLFRDRVRLNPRLPLLRERDGTGNRLRFRASRAVWVFPQLRCGCPAPARCCAAGSWARQRRKQEACGWACRRAVAGRTAGSAQRTSPVRRPVAAVSWPGARCDPAWPGRRETGPKHDVRQMLVRCLRRNSWETSPKPAHGKHEAFSTDTEVAGRIELAGDAPDHAAVIARKGFQQSCKACLDRYRKPPGKPFQGNPLEAESSDSLRTMAVLG